MLALPGDWCGGQTGSYRKSLDLQWQALYSHWHLLVTMRVHPVSGFAVQEPSQLACQWDTSLRAFRSRAGWRWWSTAVERAGDRGRAAGGERAAERGAGCWTRQQPHVTEAMAWALEGPSPQAARAYSGVAWAAMPVLAPRLDLAQRQAFCKVAS